MCSPKLIIPELEDADAPELKQDSLANALIRRSRSLPPWFSLATIARLNQFQLVSRGGFS